MYCSTICTAQVRRISVCVCFLVHNSFPIGYWLLKLFPAPHPQLPTAGTVSWSGSPFPPVTFGWNCFLITFPQLPVSWLPPPVTCCWNCFLFYNLSPLVTPPPPQLPAVGTVSWSALSCWGCPSSCPALSLAPLSPSPPSHT